MAKQTALLIVGAIVGASVVYYAIPGGEADSPGADARLESSIPVDSDRPGAGADAALTAIAALDAGTERRTAALAALEIVGQDQAGIARVAAVLPAANRFAFEADALAALAERDIAAALAIAMARAGNSLRQALLVEIGRGAARNDPLAALEAAAAIGSLELRSRFTLGIVNAWAGLDPAGMLAYLETADPESIRAPVPFDRLVLGDPEAALARLDRFPSTLRGGVERAALLALAETDAIGTLARLEELPAGGDRNELLSAVAESYGRQDTNAALAWAASLSPPSQEALNGVVTGIAATDVAGALDWVLRELEAPTVAGVDPAAALPLSPIFLGVRSGDLPMPEAAERLLAAGDPTLKSRATAALMIWSQTNAEQAVNFAIGQLERLAPGDLTALAMQTASSAPDVAARTPERLPPDHRAAWVAGVADALVRTRPEQALRFLADQRGEPGYEQGVVAVVRQLASADPPAAAELVAGSERSPQIDTAASIVASGWARQDPRAAADWALGLEQAQPIGAAASAWAAADSGAAERWALGLPRGELRDAGITGVVTAAANSGEFDATLLDALSTDPARLQAVNGAILQIARSDQARARELMATHVTDPASREQLEQQLEQIARLSAAGRATPPLPTFVMPQQ